MNTIRVGKPSILNKPSKAIVDTGTSFIVFPQELALEVAKSYNAIEDSSTFIINSCNENEIPPLVIDIGGTEFTIPSDALIYERNVDNCTVKFGTSNEDFTVLGDVFMNNYYFIFNMAVPQIQIAPLK